MFQAVAEMNEMEMENGKRIYVGRAQRKIERQGELRDKFEKLKEERLKRYQVSVYKKWLGKIFWVYYYLDFQLLLKY